MSGGDTLVNLEPNHSDQWILVTGGSRGIGRSIVEHLAQLGYPVVFTYQHAKGAADALEAAVAASGGRATGFCCDGSSEVEVKALAARLLPERGAPGALVLNAGIARDTLLMQMSTEQWDQVIDTNLRSIFLAAREYLPGMMENRDGTILLMSSVTALKGNVGQTNYAATKAAMLGIARSLALEVSRFNIRVNAIAPGFIETDMLGSFSEQQLAQIRKLVPLHRLGSAQEVAALVGFLISAGAAYITGQTFVVDGGLSA
jgi:3-oxoacyl-[acyl-carrier protein] reductase